MPPPMSRVELNGSRYVRGFEWFLHLAEHHLTRRRWRRLGFLSFYDAPYIDSDALYLSPKQTMLVMAKLAKKSDNALIIVADALEKGEMGLSSREGFDQFMSIFDRVFPNAAKYYFGPKTSDRAWLHEARPLKIPLKWLVEHPNVLAEVLSDASPVGEIIGPGDAAFEDLEGMREVLIEKLGPPSLTEEVLGKIRTAEASEYAGEAVGLMTVFISPATAVSRGMKYLGKFVSMVKERRRQEVREIYEEWQQRVENGYSVDNLRRFLDEDPNARLDVVDHVKNRGTVLIITETRDTLYDLFLPLLLRRLVEEIGYVPPHLRPRREPSSEGAGDSESGATGQTSEDDGGGMQKEPFEGKPETVLFLDAATHLSKFTRSFEFAVGIPDRMPNVSVAASFFTNQQQVTESLEKGVIEYMRNWAFVFDLHPQLFDIVTSNLPISKKAWLMLQLQELERVRSEGGVGFLEYYADSEMPWHLHVVEKPEKGLLGDVRAWFRKIR